LDIVSFINVLKATANPVAAYVVSKFTKQTQTSIQAFDGSATTAASLLTSIIADLNKIISAEGLYEASRFSGVTLRPETEFLIGSNSSVTLPRLNRLLLEDAFPGAISNSLSNRATLPPALWVNVT
jgi:hypothetical protein